MANVCCKNRGRPKTSDDDRLRRLIAEEAAVFFLQKGYGATTTEEIAVCCKISKQTLYRLFPGKTALFAAVIELKQPQWLDLVVPEDLPLQVALETIFRANISAGEERERMQFLGMIIAEGRVYPELYEILKQCGIGQSHIALAGWMQRQADKGRVELAGDALSTAYLLTDMVFGSLLRMTVEGINQRNGNVWHAHLSAVIRVFLYGASHEGKKNHPNK